MCWRNVTVEAPLDTGALHAFGAISTTSDSAVRVRVGERERLAVGRSDAGDHRDVAVQRGAAAGAERDPARVERRRAGRLEAQVQRRVALDVAVIGIAGDA